MAKKQKDLHPNKAAFLALCCALPVFILNGIANHQIEPYYSFFKIDLGSSFWAHPIGNITSTLSLLLLPFGGIVALWPQVQNGWRKIYPLNAILSVMMFMMFLVITGGLLSEFYDCSISLVPNCD